MKNNNTITYFNRSTKLGFSINKVFEPVRAEISKKRIIRNLYVSGSTASPFDLLKNIIFVYKHRNKSDLNHITGDIHYCILALIGCKSVLTIHDTVLLKNSKNSFDYFVKWLLWFYLPIKLADHVVCISEKTKQEVTKIVNKKNIHVISNPVGNEFKYEFKKFNVDNPRVLHIGTGWNKNLLSVANALCGIKCHLRIIGKLTEEQKKILESYRIDYSVAFNISDSEIYKEYLASDIVSFPSVFEGFGMPVVEGQAVGRVVLTSLIEPLLEVAGDGAHFVDPFDLSSMRSGYDKLIKDDIYRNDLIKKGSVNVLKYSSTLIGEKYIEIYNKCN